MSAKDQLPPTELTSSRARELHRLTPKEILECFDAEDQAVQLAVQAAGSSIRALASQMERTLTRGGRIFYAGAGTSGRLGSLDAAEWEPTFGLHRDRLVVLIAGGPEALHRAVEGAEDRGEEAVRELTGQELADQDLVLGISASGSAAFVRAALGEARRIGANRAKYLLFTGEMASASELAAAGLVNAVAPDQELVLAVDKLVEAIADKSPLGLAAMKRLVDEGLEQPLDVALRLEVEALKTHVGSRDMREGLAAFSEKRKPHFEGR